MNTYMAVMITILVASQIIRITQNAVQLRRQKKLIERMLDDTDDMDTRYMHNLIIACLERELEGK